MAITPSKIAGDTESSQQIAFFCWSAYPQVRAAFPELEWMHHIPNGGDRAEQEITRMIRGNTLKKEGVKAGVLDVFLPVPNGQFYGLYIEFKRPGKAGMAAMSDKQKEFASFVQQQGYQWYCVDDWKVAARCVASYLNSHVDESETYEHLFEGM